MQLYQCANDGSGPSACQGPAPQLWPFSSVFARVSAVEGRKTIVKSAVFLDRDGTLSREIGYVNHVDNLELLPAAAEGLRRLRRSGFALVVATNQAGAARGYFPLDYIEKAQRRLVDLFEAEGVEFDGLYVCPHHPSSSLPELRRDCDCRKPKPGLILRAASELDIDVGRSYVIGDKYTDVETAHRAGARGVLVLTGYGRGELEHFGRGWPRPPDAIAGDLIEAAEWILRDAGRIGAPTGTR